MNTEISKPLLSDGPTAKEQREAMEARISQRNAVPDMLAALEKCDNAFASWQVGQIPGRPEDILALIAEVRAAIAKAKGGAR